MEAKSSFQSSECKLEVWGCCRGYSQHRGLELCLGVAPHHQFPEKFGKWLIARLILGVFSSRPHHQQQLNYFS